MIKINNPAVRFVVLFIPLIIIWFTFYHYIYKIDLLISSDFDSLSYFSIILSKQSNFILEIFGFITKTEIHGEHIVAKILNYKYTHGVWIGEPCNGIKIFGLFSIFIMCFKGSIKNKLWFIPLGVLILHLLNIIRIAILTYIAAINPNWLNFNHNITFQLIIYGAMLFLWLLWINKFYKIRNNE